MIAYVRGKLTEKAPTHAVVETNGVGFKLFIPLSSYKALGDVGEDVRILAHLHAREDALQLYGFATEEERGLFLLLISVTGIGPRLAQGILSGISVDDFKRAVQNQDLEALMSAPGVGRKTAERLVLELREKVEGVKSGPMGIFPVPTTQAGEEAVRALVSLGYKRSKAQAVVQGVLKEAPDLPVEEVIRRALRRV